MESVHIIITIITTTIITTTITLYSRLIKYHRVTIHIPLPATCSTTDTQEDGITATHRTLVGHLDVRIQHPHHLLRCTLTPIFFIILYL